jgi:transcriptional regulator with XRE-family HTH domain
VSGLSKIWENLCDKEYRTAFVASQLKRGLPTQIRVMLKDRGWVQGDLAQRSGLKQGVVSRAADPDYGNLTINTILRLAAGFDVAYVGRFVPFSDLARWYADLSESALSVPSFEDDTGFIHHKGPEVAAALVEPVAHEAAVPIVGVGAEREVHKQEPAQIPADAEKYAEMLSRRRPTRTLSYPGAGLAAGAMQSAAGLG